MSDGTAITGAVVSTTETVNDPVATFSAASVAVTVTVETPSANVVAPDGTYAITTSETRSVADAPAGVYDAPLGPVASSVTFAGSARAGGVVSRTVTLNAA